MKTNLESLEELPKEIEVEYIVDVGFLSYSPRKDKCFMNLKIEITSGIYHLYYKLPFNSRRENRYDLYVYGKDVKELVEKMKTKLKNTSLKVSKEEWENAVEYAKTDV